MRAALAAASEVVGVRRALQQQVPCRVDSCVHKPLTPVESEQPLPVRPAALNRHRHWRPPPCLYAQAQERGPQAAPLRDRCGGHGADVRAAARRVPQDVGCCAAAYILGHHAASGLKYAFICAALKSLSIYAQHLARVPVHLKWHYSVSIRAPAHPAAASNPGLLKYKYKPREMCPADMSSATVEPASGELHRKIWTSEAQAALEASYDYDSYPSHQQVITKYTAYCQEHNIAMPDIKETTLKTKITAIKKAQQAARLPAGGGGSGADAGDGDGVGDGGAAPRGAPAVLASAPAVSQFVQSDKLVKRIVKNVLLAMGQSDPTPVQLLIVEKALRDQMPKSLGSA